MAEEKTAKHRWIFWAMIVSIIVLLFSPFLIFRAVNKAKFNQKVAKLKAAKYPVSLDDLETAYVLPKGVKNAADVYQKAFRAYSEPNETEQKLLPVSGGYVRAEGMPPYPAEVMEAVRVRLEQNAECLDLLDQAARMEHCLFSRTCNNHFFTRDYFTEIKKGSQLIAERNLYFSQMQQTDELFESTLTGIGLTKAFSVQPMLIDHLVTVAIKALVVSGLQDSLNLTQFREDQLYDLQHRFCEMRKADTCYESLICERSCVIEILRLPGQEYIKAVSMNSVQERALLFVYLLSGMKEKDSVLYLELSEKRIALKSLPYDGQFAGHKLINKELESYSGIHYGLEQTFGHYFRLVEINSRVTGQMLCAETALAIERYRLKYKVLPPSLEALVPEFIETVHLDPFDGKPLRYMLRKEGGYIVYSIGPDCLDNGGLDQDSMRKIGKKDEADWPFTVKR